MSKNLKLTGFILLLAFIVLIHFLWLNRFPPGLIHDELELILSSKTYSLFGTDLSNYGFPISLFKTETLGQISAIPAITLSSFWSIIPMNYVTVRIPFVLINIFTAVSLGFLCNVLFKKRVLSYLVTIIFLLNPWSFFLSRYAFDTVFSLFFYVLGTALFLHLKGWRLIFPFILFLLGFFSYISAKILFLPIIICCAVYKICLLKNKKQPVHDAIFIFSLTTVFLFLFFFACWKIPGATISNRANEVLFLDNQTAAKTVNTLRNQSISTPLTKIFINKLTENTRLFLSGYLSAFSPQTLFSSSENLFFHGFFYLFDFLLFIIGAVKIMKKHNKEGIFLLALLLISPLPTALSQHGQSLLHRSFMFLPVFLIFVAYGLYDFYEWLKKKISVNLAILFIAAVYLISFTRFMFLYFYQLPVFAQESYLVSYRVLAKYLILESSLKKNIVVITNEPRPIYLSVILALLPDEQKKLLIENKKNNKYSENFYIKNITFTKKCPTDFNNDSEYILECIFGKCFPTAKWNYSIINQRDAGDIFRIYGGALCQGTSLKSWQSAHLISDYLIEKMDKNVFCQRWVAKHN